MWCNFFCNNSFSPMSASDLYGIRVCYLSKAAIHFHTDRQTIKKIIPGDLIWSKYDEYLHGIHDNTISSRWISLMSVFYLLRWEECRLIRAWKGNSRVVWGNNLLVLWNESVIASASPCSTAISKNLKPKTLFATSITLLYALLKREMQYALLVKISV